MNRVLAYYKNHLIEAGLLLVIVAAAAVFRLYKIDQYMRFLGDEGRDALVVLHMVRDHHIPLIGPGTSVGNMYLGPWYYYMMLIPMALTGLNPAAAAIMVGIIGTVTTAFLYYAGKRFFSPVAGIIAALFYAVFYLPVTTSRSSWNPYPMPFFALLTIFAVYEFVVQRRPWWIIVSAAALALALNMHLMGVLLIPVVGIFWLGALWWYWKKQASLGWFFLNSVLALVVFLTIMSPLYFFDRRHNYINYHAFIKFLTDRQDTVNLNPINTISKFWQTFNDLYVSRLLMWVSPTASQPIQQTYAVLGTVLSIAIVAATAASSAWMFWKRRVSVGLLLVGLWLIVGVVGMTLIKTHVYDHYFGFLFPAIFLLVGYLLSLLWTKSIIGKAVLVALVAALLCLNLVYNPLRDQPGRQLQRTQKVAQYIINQTNGSMYNFALISQNNYFDAYEFYLTLLHHPFTMIDPEHFQQTIANQLYVVCEDPVCKPLNNDRAEISRFGWAKIDSEVQVNDVKVFKLSHTVPPNSPPQTKP